MPKGVGYRRSVDAARFTMTPRADVPRSAFDIQHRHLTTFDAGRVYPIYVQEVVPGDSLKLDMTALVRLSTPLVPVMDNMWLESFFFYVPYRILWSNWERFMGDKASISDVTEFLTPQVNIASTEMPPNALGVGTLPDYFGITNNGTANTLSVSAFPFRAYVKIWNDFFRDEDLASPLTEATGDGPDTIVGQSYALNLRYKKKDYFTSARPWPMKAANITRFPSTSDPLAPGWGFYNPIGPAAAPVSGLGVASGEASAANVLPSAESGSRTPTWPQIYKTSSEDFWMAGQQGSDFPSVRVLVNDIRTAVLVQGMFERNARGGTRYNEIIEAHFGVRPPDMRLQRPEYLGGGRTPISVVPVAQTSATGVAGTTTVLGELAGIGSALARNHGFSGHSFVEHGCILGLISTRTDLTYQQGVERLWHRRTPYDFYWPGLAHLGEQAIMKREIYMDGSANDVLVFGFQERWSEYKYKPSRTSGFFRSTVSTPLDMWHYGQEFGSAPSLNSAFVHDDPPMTRVLQTDINFGEQFLGDFYFQERWARPMPMFSVPGVGAHL